MKKEGGFNVIETPWWAAGREDGFRRSEDGSHPPLQGMEEGSVRPMGTFRCLLDFNGGV
jgi:hypothetical protein